MAKIKSIEGRKILDSREKPTVEVKVTTDTGFTGIDSVPSGTSTGKKEAKLVDVEVACANINSTICTQLVGMEIENQSEIDRQMIELDGTEDKSQLGANAILGVSLAVARTAAMTNKMPLYWYINKMFRQVSGLQIEPKIPTAMMVMICGGQHVQDAQENLGVQEFSVLGAEEDGRLVWDTLEQLFPKKNIETSRGLEGAFAPKMKNNEKALEILEEAIKITKNKFRGELKIGLDIAGNNYEMTTTQIINLFKKFNIFSLEDPFGEEDWEKFGQLKLELEELNRPFLLIGDDLFATHKSMLEKGITKLVANGIIIKPNQVGTLSEVFEVIKIAKKADFTTIVSHRSGETLDTFIADLAVGTAADYLKAGAPVPNERLFKYRRLKEIAQEL